ncbi:MAG: scramblase [Marinilabiliales bacterium]|nr:MAG: scramblase [Marinilabiliales bacterium]
MSFFDTNSYFIDEKVNMLKFENEYKVFNDQAVQIGSVKQKLSSGAKVLSLLINKAMMPFHLEIRDQNDVLQATISRGWTFWMSKIAIKNAEGVQVGTVAQKWAFMKPTFKIYNTQNVQIAEITGDWKAWNFTMYDANKNQIGTITKKWAGVAKELFTTADKYNVNLTSPMAQPQDKIAIIASAITIDMVLKESK